jgi:hypothetical protein
MAVRLALAWRCGGDLMGSGGSRMIVFQTGEIAGALNFR